MNKPDRAYHHGDLRTALLDEAAAMIAEGGTDSVTMRALGERLGVSRAAAYRHFEDKTALLVAVAAAGFRRLNERLQDIGAGAPSSSLERARRMGEAYVRFALENPAHYRLMYGREAMGRQNLPKLREAGSELFEQLVEVIRAYQESGGIKREDPRAQAYVAWSAVHGLASLLIEGQIMSSVDVDALIRQTTQTVLDGMRA
ncbi:MAG: TetR/AcrR family transcriptional regulator [marine benthic group bacterium]|nr:TetR/AcrR family transcriptional regulator [Gemmatimonadota bacterium]